MRYAIVYSSETGNTAKLAEKVKSMLPIEDCVYSGLPGEKALKADLIFVGFWTDKGSCDEVTGGFLDGLRKKRIFIFGTAGFGGSEEYFASVILKTQAHIDTSNTMEGSFMCQGKMRPRVREHYEAMLADGNDLESVHKFIENFDLALTHPDEEDLNRLERAIKYWI